MILYDITVELGDGEQAEDQAKRLKEWILHQFGHMSSTGTTTVHYPAYYLSECLAIMTYCEMVLITTAPGFSFTITGRETAPNQSAPTGPQEC